MCESRRKKAHNTMRLGGLSYGGYDRDGGGGGKMNTELRLHFTNVFCCIQI